MRNAQCARQFLLLENMEGQHTFTQCNQTANAFLMLPSMPIKSSGRIVPPGWAPLQPKQSVLSLIVLSDWSSLN